MKNFKKITLLLMVAAVLFTPVLGVFSPFLSKASAATVPADASPSSPASSATPQDQISSYLYIRAIAHCLYSSPEWGVNGFHDETGTDDINKYNWFHSSSVSTLGYLDTDDENGYVSCHDASKWMPAAFNLWGISDGLTAACNTGWKRYHGDTNETTDACLNGDGNVNQGLDYKYGDQNDTDGKKRVDAFVKYINSKYYSVNSTALPSMSDSAKYVYYTQSFQKLCGAHTIDNSLYNKNDQHLYQYTDADGKVQSFQADKSKTDKVRTRVDNAYTSQNPYVDDTSNPSIQFLSCGYLVDQIPSTIAAYKAAVAVTGDNSTTSADDSGSIGIDCGGFSFSTFLTIEWLACPLVKGGMKLAGSLEDNISGLLCINETTVFGSNHQTCANSNLPTNKGSSGAFHAAWSAFRNIALGFMGIAGLVMVLSQALGFEFVDAYTVKKTLPRILIAGIGITLSWPLLAFFVQLSNGLGIGVRSFIYYPFLHSSMNSINLTALSGGAKALNSLFGIGGATLGVGAILASTSILGVLSLVATAVLAIAVAFFTLIVRNMLVVFLILASPLAIAAYILPNTEKYWKLWWEWLSKALLVFPIITGMIAIGHVFAAITSQTGSNGTVSSTLNVFVAIIAYFAPYFLIPAAFRFAGGAMATIGGFTNDRSRGVFDRLKEQRKNDRAKTWKRSTEGERFNKFGFQNTKVGGIVNRRLANVTQPASFVPGSLGDPARARLSTNVSRLTNEGAKHLQELGLLDDAAGNEFIKYGHSVGQLRSRVKELEGEGKVGLAAQLSAYASLAGDRGAILGAMKLNAGFGKLEDGSLEQLDHLFSNSQGDQAAKQAAFGDLIFTSKGAGNWATYAARIEQQKDSQGKIIGSKVKTMSQEDFREEAMGNMANALLDAGPNELSRIKPYTNVTERTDANGNKYTVEYNTRDLTAEAVARGVEKAKSPDEFYRALEQLAMQRASGAYNTPKMKAAFDQAMQYVDNANVSLGVNNPDRKSTRELYNDIEQRVRRSSADEEALRRQGEMGSGGGPAPTPGG